VIVLDTNVISEILRPQPDVEVVTWLESLTGDVVITADAGATAIGPNR
jgi:predicted nucleic acid-binding protein